eukprot:CAMPEP_0181391404 /NCGR_PEP_ID=MMETSP1106-20121128/26016_1 /TAXON_ID=81844 /ORGANISM="Mantoniella antarctica, Strain SL-175" /LENGTH=50 /DNA_ID=CAMNT_0023512411 /DNA_START=658 /DNA_END=809 /DNA_ORIENTATION=-
MPQRWRFRASPATTAGTRERGAAFMPQQRTKLIFGAPADGVGYVDDTAAA